MPGVTSCTTSTSGPTARTDARIARTLRLLNRTFIVITRSDAGAADSRASGDGPAKPVPTPTVDPTSTAARASDAAASRHRRATSPTSAGASSVRPRWNCTDRAANATIAAIRYARPDARRSCGRP